MAEEHRRITVASSGMELYDRLAKPTPAGLLVLLVVWLTLYRGGVKDFHIASIIVLAPVPLREIRS